MAERKHFKTQANFDNFAKMHPKAQEVVKFTIETALELGVELPIITETLTTKEYDKALGRVSQSHNEGRAFDFRTWNLTLDQLHKITDALNLHYGSIGAINKLGQKQLVVYHDIGKGPHLHVQLERYFKIA